MGDPSGRARHRLVPPGSAPPSAESTLLGRAYSRVRGSGVFPPWCACSPAPNLPLRTSASGLRLGPLSLGPGDGAGDCLGLFFLLFMVPVGFLVSRTVGLQTLAANVAARLSGIFGIGVIADGTVLRALNGSFEFEVAGGCSGIRSLTAMTVLAALFVHFTQSVFWKKIVIFGGSLVFALLGNLVRIFTVVLVARFIDPKFASSIYHDYSGFIFFPVAVLAMLGVSNLLNRDWSHWVTPEPPPPLPAKGAAVAKAGEAKAASPISYDY